MKKLLLLLFLFSSFSASALTGYWERMHPELNGEVPGPRFNAYMCPIGERKVLILNGSGPGNPYYYNDTWIYHYDEDRWQRVQCDSQPDTYHSYLPFPMVNVNRDVVMARGSNQHWLFYLDSLKWVNIGSGYLWAYNVAYAEGKQIYYSEYDGGTTAVIEFDLQTLQGKATQIKTSYNLNQAAGHPSLVQWYYIGQGGLLNNNNPVFFTPGVDSAKYYSMTKQPFVYFDTSDFNWKNVERDFKIKAKDKTPTPNLLENILLTYSETMDTTYFYYYDSASNKMKEESMIILNNPPKSTAYNKMVKIKDSVVFLFCGYRYNYETQRVDSTSDTWVFRLTDTAKIVVDATEDDAGHIFYLGNNNYFLKEIESAELYDLQGIFMGKYYDNGVVDLNKYASSVYLLRWTTDSKKYRTEKIMKK